VKKVVLAYSGGLDTSVAVAWLREQFDAEVVTLTVDLGGGSLRPGVERRAMSAGASRAYVVDARERFITDFVWPHLQANALYQGAYPLATALARPLIAQLLVEVAAREFYFCFNVHPFGNRGLAHWRSYYSLLAAQPSNRPTGRILDTLEYHRLGHGSL
jgi:argininosuccinate synthase